MVVNPTRSLLYFGAGIYIFFGACVVLPNCLLFSLFVTQLFNDVCTQFVNYTGQMEPSTELILSESQQGIPDPIETKDNAECYVPGVALSQGMSPSPGPTQPAADEAQMDDNSSVLIKNGKCIIITRAHTQ